MSKIFITFHAVNQEKNPYIEKLLKEGKKTGGFSVFKRDTNFAVSRNWLTPPQDQGNPEIKIVPKVIDMVLNALSYITVIVLWAFTYYVISISPDVVPIHWSGRVADGYGNKDTLWVFPVIATLIFVSLSLFPINRPWIANYPVRITEENAERQYRYMIRMFCGMKISISILFSGLVFSCYEASQKPEAVLAFWAVPLILAFFIPLFIYFGFALTDKKYKKPA